MALLFDATSENVNFGSYTSLDVLNPMTVIAWAAPDTISSSNGLMLTKYLFGSNGGWGFSVGDWWDSSIPNSFGFNINDSNGGSDIFQSESGVVSEDSSWQYFAGTWSGPGNYPSLYYGTLTSVATLLTAYGFRATTHDSTFLDASNNLYMGMHSNGGTNFLGRIAVAAVFERVLSLAEIQSFQFRPRIIGSNCVLLAYPGLHGGSIVPDLSGTGNNGSITGATVDDHVPLPPPFGFDIGLPFRYPSGTWCWGHDTGVTEDNTGDLADGTGTAEVLNSGVADIEAICIDTGEEWISPAKEIGEGMISVTYNQYNSGSGTPGIIEYRYGSNQTNCEAAGWNTYSVPFDNTGYPWVQVRFRVSA